MFDWIGTNWVWCSLGCIGLFVVMSVIGYFSLRARADRVLQTDGLLEALRMLNAGGMDGEITKLLDTQLPKWPITDEIKSAVGELQGLKTGLDAAGRAGVPQNLIAAFKQDTLKALDQMWHLAERVSGAGAQSVEYASLEEQMAPYVEQVKRVCQSAKEGRLTMARLALADHDANSQALEEATAGLHNLSEAASALRMTDIQRRDGDTDGTPVQSSNNS